MDAPTETVNELAAKWKEADADYYREHIEEQLQECFAPLISKFTAPKFWETESRFIDRIRSSIHPEVRPLLNDLAIKEGTSHFLYTLNRRLKSWDPEQNDFLQYFCRYAPQQIARRYNREYIKRTTQDGSTVKVARSVDIDTEIKPIDEER